MAACTMHQHQCDPNPNTAYYIFDHGKRTFIIRFSPTLGWSLGNVTGLSWFRQQAERDDLHRWMVAITPEGEPSDAELDALCIRSEDSYSREDRRRVDDLQERAFLAKHAPTLLANEEP